MTAWRVGACPPRTTGSRRRVARRASAAGRPNGQPGTGTTSPARYRASRPGGSRMRTRASRVVLMQRRRSCSHGPRGGDGDLGGGAGDREVTSALVGRLHQVGAAGVALGAGAPDPVAARTRLPPHTGAGLALGDPAVGGDHGQERAVAVAPHVRPGRCARAPRAGYPRPEGPWARTIAALPRPPRAPPGRAPAPQRRRSHVRVSSRSASCRRGTCRRASRGIRRPDCRTPSSSAASARFTRSSALPDASSPRAARSPPCGVAGSSSRGPAPGADRPSRARRCRAG